jgi:L-asparaginase II
MEFSLPSHPPILVHTVRGSCIETRHTVHGAIVSIDGVLDTFGDDAARYPVRSTAKPLQALSLVRSPAMQSVTTDRLAIATASHNGETIHLDLVSTWLAELGLSEASLGCPHSVPFLPHLSRDYLLAGNQPRRLAHNCSGKHTGFLSQCVVEGFDPADYLNPNRPFQERVIGGVLDACHVAFTPELLARDGCRAPVLCLRLDELARGMVSLTPTGEHANEGSSILEAMTAHPHLVAGTDRFDTAAITSGNGALITKVGAAGLHVAVLPALGVAIAVKAEDGSKQAAEAGLVHLLSKGLGMDRPDGLDHIDWNTFADNKILDDAGEVAGRVHVVSDHG